MSNRQRTKRSVNYPAEQRLAAIYARGYLNKARLFKTLQGTSVHFKKNKSYGSNGLESRKLNLMEYNMLKRSGF